MPLTKTFKVKPMFILLLHVSINNIHSSPVVFCFRIFDYNKTVNFTLLNNGDNSADASLN